MTFNGLSNWAFLNDEVVLQAKTPHSAATLASHKERRGQKYSLASVIPDPHPEFSAKEKHM